MNFLDQMKNRYTVKKYNPQGKISEEQIATLQEILNLSPSSINSQPWNFIFVNDPELKRQLGRSLISIKKKCWTAAILLSFR
ncbi:hypothetical protein KCF3NO3_23060 [Chryseobacterium sp. KCF3-3]